MSQHKEVFEVGDPVIYVGFGLLVYGIVTEVKVENREEEGVEVRRYRIATDNGGILTRLSDHLRRAPIVAMG
jgi:hypothetical protein